MIRSICLMLCTWVFCQPCLALPQKVLDILARDRPKFNRLSHNYTDEQNSWLLNRYVDLLLNSPLTLDVEIDRKELTEAIHAFKNTAATESVSKKEKRSHFKGRWQEMLTEIAKTFNGHFRGELFDLEFECEEKHFSLPFHYSKYQLTIEGLDLGEPDATLLNPNMCLWLAIDKYGSAELERVNTLFAACPIPPLKKTGTCLLNIAEKLARAAGTHRFELDDWAEVRCKDNRMPVKLSELLVYQGKPTWYQSKGYSFTDEPEAFNHELERMRKYPLLKFRDEFHDAISKHPNEKRLFAWVELLKNFFVFENTNQEQAVGPFMSWLWDKDCSAYAKINQVARELSTEFKFPVLVHGGKFHKNLQ